MKTKKSTKFISLIIFLFIIFISVSNAAYAAEGRLADVLIDGNEYLGLAARNIDGSTMVPVRDFSEVLGASDVTFSDGRVKVYANGLEITADADENYIEANGRCLYNDSANLLLENGRMYVPIRSLVKAFGGSVYWNPTGSVSVTTGTTPILNADDYYDESSLYWLSRIISSESRGEPLDGQIAVGNVVLNRVNNSAYPDTIYGVIFDKQFGVQFTPAYTGAVYSKPADISVTAAKICLEGYSLNSDILYFYQPSASSSTWFSRNCEYAFTIGCHKFYI